MNNNENKSEHLDKFEQSMASLDKAQTEIKACMDGMSVPEQGNEASYATLHEHMKKMHAGLMNAMASLRESMHHAHNYIHDRIDRSNAHVNNRMDKHMDSSTHLPPIMGPGKMQACIDKLGLNDDYEVQKRPIFASSSYSSTIKAGKHGIKVELDLNKPKN